MVIEDRRNKKKIQCWIDQDVWDKLESLGYTSPTIAVTKAFEKLLEDPEQIPNESHSIPNRSHEIPELQTRIEGLQLLIEEKDKRIEDLRQDKENLSLFAHYFKSLQYKQLEASTEPIETFTQEPDELPIVSPGEAHIVQEEREIVTQEPESKPAIKPTRTHTGDEPIKKACKNCGEIFETFNPKKETCSSKCRTAFNRRKK